MVHVDNSKTGFWRLLLSSRLAYFLYFSIIIFTGTFTRFYGYDWDDYRTIHPDERQVVSFQVPKIHFPRTEYRPPLSSWLSPLNPKFFAYGTLPMYLLRLTFYGYKTYLCEGAPVNIYAFARILMATMGVLTLFVVYFLGTRAFNSTSGILAATFLCFTVLHIQHSHFYVVEIMQTLFLTAGLLYGLKIVKKGKGYVLFGVFLGLALATKVSSLALLAPFFTALVLRHWHIKRFFSIKIWVWAVIALIVALVVCFIGMPFAFLDSQEFFKDLKDESRMVRLDPPRFYTYQYVGTIPYWYHIKTIFWYSAGPPLAILMFLGMIYSLKKGIKNRSKIDLYLLSWLIPFFLVTGQFGTKFARYMIPILPTLAVLAALYVTRYKGFFKKLIPVITFIAIAYSVLYSIAYVKIYSKPHTIIQASEWVYQDKNVFPGAHYLIETGAEFNIPVSIRGKGHKGKFQERNLDLYREPDNENKARQIAANLEWADYIFSSSKRVYGSVFRVPDRFPITCNYYRNLFAGNIGFELVKTFTNPPSLFGLKLNEDLADESFRVYDHPKIHIFKKIAYLDKETLASHIISPPRSIQNISMETILTTDAGEKITLDKYASLQEYTSLPTGFSFHDIDQKLAIFIWYFMIQFFGLIAYPMTFFLFKKLPDRGYAFSKLVGILFFVYFNWIIVSLHILPNTLVSLMISLGIFIVTNGIFYIVVRNDMKTFHQQGIKQFWWTESVFGALFSLFLVFRMFHPDIYWSESSMDLSFITSSMRSLYFPPWDTWAAGFRVNYYYFGHYTVAMLTKLSGLPVKYTYNLAFVTIPALVGSFLISIMYNCTRRFKYGIWAIIFGIFTCNLDAFFYTWAAYGQKALKLAQLPASSLQRLTSSASNSSTSFLSMLTGMGGEVFQKFLYYSGVIFQKLIDWGLISTNLFFDKDYPRPFRYFRSTHEIIPWTVHEFPFFTFTFVDLHAHLLVMPMYLLFIGMELNLFFRSGNGLGILGEGLGRWIRLFLYSLFLTVIYATSSWTYPVHILILLFIFSLISYLSKGKREGVTGFSFRRLINRVSLMFYHGIFPVLLIVGLGIILFLPYFIHFYRPGMGLGWVGTFTTKLKPYLTIMAFFDFMLLSLIVLFAWRLFNYSKYLRGIKGGILLLTCIVMSFTVSLLLSSAIGKIFQPPRDYTVAGIVFPLLAGSFYFLSRQDLSREKRFIFLIALFFGLIGFGLEIAHVKDDYGSGSMGRFNNIFKYYLFSWYLGAIFSAYLLYRLRNFLPGESRFKRIFRWGWWCAFIPFLATTLVFIPVGLKNRRQAHNYRPYRTTPTLDGFEWVQKNNKDIHAGINWLIKNVKFSPVILEASGNPRSGKIVDYNYNYSFVSAATGLPTVIGWENHVEQRHYRYGKNKKLDVPMAAKLNKDIKQIFNSLDIKKVMQLLNKHKIEYIFVGPQERRIYDSNGLEKFDFLKDQFPIVFRQGKVTIYHVKDTVGVAANQKELESFKQKFSKIIEQRKQEKERRAQLEELKRLREIERQKSLPPIYMSRGGFGIRKGMFKEPRGIAADNEGNLYVADFRNYRIQKFDSAGKFLTMWGEKGNKRNQFMDLCDVTVDSKGFVYVADTFNSRIQKFSTNGRFIKMWRGVDRPRGISVGPDNLVYVSSTSSNEIKVFTTEGKFVRKIGAKGSGRLQFNHPIGIAAHGDGNLYIVDTKNKRIQVVTSTGRFVKEIKVPGWEGEVFVEPYISILKNGDIAVTDPTTHSILRFNKDGKLVKKFNFTGRFLFPMGIVCTKEGKVYVVDSRHHRVQRVLELEK